MAKKQVLCRVKASGRNITFDSLENSSSNIQTQIKEDIKYGFMTPQTGGVITYAILNGDQEFSGEELERGTRIAFYKWMPWVPIYFIKVKKTDNPMITVQFSTEEEDSNLTSATIAYMGYPIDGSSLYGVCVFNKRYYFTVHGNNVSGTELIANGLPAVPTSKYMTWDYDQILAHELGHGVFGLPHSPNSLVLMSKNYGIMSEFSTSEDHQRAQAKAGKRFWPSRYRTMFSAWFGKWSD